MKYSKVPGVLVLCAVISMGQISCGGGGGSPGDDGIDGITVSGNVLAPQGQVASLKKTSILIKLTNLLFQPVFAAVNGLLPVPDGTVVSLIRLNTATAMVSDVLASTTTLSGVYSFDLTSLDVGYAADLIVRVESKAVQINAFVTGENTDILPVSEATFRLVLDKILSIPGTTLSNFTLTELRDLYFTIDLLSSLEGIAAGLDIESTVTTLTNLVILNNEIAAYLLAASEPGQTNIGPGDTGNMTPLAQADTWNSIGTTSEYPQSFFSETQVSGTTLISGTLTTNVVESNMDNSNVPSTEYLVKDSLGIMNWGNDFSGDIITSQITPFRQVRYPIHIGETTQILNKTGLVWMEDLDFDGLFETFDVSAELIASELQAINIQMGQFLKTLPVEINLDARLTLSSDGSSATVTNTVKQWLAPGVGKVKQTISSEARIGQTVILSESSESELAGYLVGGIGHGVLSRFAISNSVATANSDTTTPGRPAVSSDGTGYLVVTCREVAWGPPSGLIGTLVSGHKTVSAEFTLSPHSCQSPAPSIAFDGTNYLVIFSRDAEILGVSVSPSGTVGTVFPVSSDQQSNFNARIAFDGTNYLVIWQRYSSQSLYDIHAARVQPDGTVLGEFTVFSATGDQKSPSLAFDGTNYFVVWEDSRDGSGPTLSTDIYGTRISTAGVVLDSPEIPIVTSTNYQGAPEIAFDGNNYLVVWLDTSIFMDPIPGSIYGRRLDTNGNLLDGNSADSGISINTAPYGKGNLALTFNGSNYLLAWRVGDFSDSPHAGIYYARISLSGVLLDIETNSEGLIASGLPRKYSRLVYPSIASSNNGSLLTWLDNIELSGTQKNIDAALIFSR